MDGTGFDLYIPASNARGRANLYVDDKLVTTIDQYTATSINNKLIYSTNSLSQGSHTVKLEVLGQKNSSSKGNAIIFDKVVIR